MNAAKDFVDENLNLDLRLWNETLMDDIKPVVTEKVNMDSEMNFLPLRVLEYSDCQDFDARIKIKVCLVAFSYTSVNFPTQTLKEENKLVVKEKH